MTENIPEEVLQEILCRLPVKSLLRCRCVSRSWQSMIDDPDFCRLHLNVFEDNTHQTHLLFLGNGASGHDCVVRRSDTLEVTATIENVPIYGSIKRPKGNFDDFGYPGSWAMVCFMDGVILLSELRSSNLMLWNPSIRKFHSLPPLPETYDEIKSGSFGLGFDPLTKDFKHVRLVRLGENDLHSVLVYSVQARSWKAIQFQGKASSGWRWSLFWFLGTRGVRTVCYRGYLCYISKNLDLGTIELVSFDLSKEVFASIPVPNDDNERAVIFYLDVVVANGECVLVKYDDEATSGSIWVLQSPGTESGFQSMYWKKRCSFCTGLPDRLPFLHALKNGDLLLRSLTKVVKYSVETHEIKAVLKGGDAAIMNVFDYDESLMLLK